MKAFEVTGRVVSHALFQPNPKDEPEIELAKIVLTLSPATKSAKSHTKAVLVVEKDSIFEDLVLGRMLVLTIKDHPQQDLFMPNGDPKEQAAPPKPGEPQLSLEGAKGAAKPKTGKPQRQAKSRRGSEQLN